MNIVIANVLTGTALLWDFLIGYRINDKEKIVLCNLLSSFLQLIGMILLGSLAGVIGYIITLSRLITIYLKDKYHKDWLPIFFLYIGLYALVFHDENFLVANLIFISNLCSFIPKWISKDMQKIRIGGSVGSCFSIGSNLLIANYAAIPFNILSIVCTIIQLTNSLIPTGKPVGLSNNPE